MFLRGTGTRSVGGKSILRGSWGYGYDRNPYHRHNINITTSEAGEHRHALRKTAMVLAMDIPCTPHQTVTKVFTMKTMII